MTKEETTTFAESASLPAPEQADSEYGAERYHGFSLQSVTWGYREIFARTIEELFAQGCLGTGRAQVTAKFFEMLKQADQTCFDHVLQQFLGALNPANRWIMDLPGVFTDLVELGADLARKRLYYGIRFFEVMAGGGLGDSPAKVRACLNWLRRLRQVDDELAMAFLAGYGVLSARLRPLELERYVEVGLEIFSRNQENGCRFLKGELASSEAYILSLTQECRLGDVDSALKSLLKALTGNEFEVADLGSLDADDIHERGTVTLTLNRNLYLPARCRSFPTAAANRSWYMLCTVIAAAMTLDNAFTCIHGHGEYRTCLDLTGDDNARASLFQVLETARVLRRAVKRWPGARRLLEWGLAAEQLNAPRHCGGYAQLLADVMNEGINTEPVCWLREVADSCINCFDTAARLDEPLSAAVIAAYPRLAAAAPEPVACISDFLFPVSFSEPPADQFVADLKNAAANRKDREQSSDAGANELRSAAGDNGLNADEDEEDEKEADAGVAAFVYDEWDFQQNEYRPGWCHVHQHQVEPVKVLNHKARNVWLEQSRQVRNIFARIRPELTWREKHLADGDDINIDHLTTHLTERRLDPDAPVRFYEKPLVNRRDLAVLILLDVSGSTGGSLGDSAQVLDVEKQAAVIFGQGLAALDDSFAVCGFSSNGREQCEFLQFKDFVQPWNETAMDRIMSAWPRSSTRIGPALRHAGFLLGQQPARQRLIMLVTDGKPMDQGYDPQTRYAQHDVRMACVENARQGIHTFAITTAENSLADMEIMFPRRRFIILPAISRLPQILPQLYLRLTF